MSHKGREVVDTNPAAKNLKEIGQLTKNNRGIFCCRQSSYIKKLKTDW